MSAANDLTAPTPDTIAAYVRRHTARAKKILTGMHEHGPHETVREAYHGGHRIVIGTTYRIEVDGRPIGGHFVVTEDGQVQCHALPNYTFSSAVDLVKSMIDIFPEDFSGTPADGGDAHGGHAHEGEHPGTRGVAMPMATRRSAAKKPASARRAGKRTSKGGRHGRH